jgi:hypothetical protein
MSLRPPQNPQNPARPESLERALQAEFLAEQAQSLGEAGRRVEASLAALRACDATNPQGQERQTLVEDAAYAVWSLFVQRELAGLRSQAEVIRHYAIPREVLNSVGRVTARPATRR